MKLKSSIKGDTKLNFCLLCDNQIIEAPSWRSFFRLNEEQLICFDCSKEFKHADTIEEREPLDRIHSLYTYNEAMRNYLHQFKFLQDVALAGVFAGDIKKHLKGDSIIIPIPMHPEKQKRRTFSPVDEILNSAKVPYVHLLEKTGTESMGEKTKAERLSVAPLFKMKNGSLVESKSYTIVDDIYTTGTTLEHAANVLKEAGAKRVEALTLIRAE